MPQFRAVLFDFDGTLADSFAAITASVNHVLAHHGQPALREDQVKGLVGHGLEELMRAVLPDSDPHTNARIYRDHHPAIMGPLTRLLPGVAEGLPALHAAGIKMGVCSNKPSFFTRELVSLTGLQPYLDVVFGPDDVGVAKPHPKMLLEAIERLGVPRETALFVGDMPVDIATGKNAAVPTWVVPTGSSSESELRHARPDRVYPSMVELIRDVLR